MPAILRHRESRAHDTDPATESRLLSRFHPAVLVVAGREPLRTGELTETGTLGGVQLAASGRARSGRAFLSGTRRIPGTNRLPGIEG